jgi:hypothetical protein
MDRLKSSEAIRAASSVRVIRVGRISISGACHVGRRWNRALLAAASTGDERSEISGVRSREASGRIQR